MTFKRILAALAMAAGTGLGAASSAQAHPLVWSVGLSQPGVAVTIGNAPPPVPQVTYYPVYAPPPVLAPVQVVVPRAHVGSGHGRHRGWHPGHHWRHGHGHGRPGRGHDH